MITGFLPISLVTLLNKTLPYSLIHTTTFNCARKTKTKVKLDIA